MATSAQLESVVHIRFSQDISNAFDLQTDDFDSLVGLSK
jgi:hypothetical protein